MALQRAVARDDSACRVPPGPQMRYPVRMSLRALFSLHRAVPSSHRSILPRSLVFLRWSTLAWMALGVFGGALCAGACGGKSSTEPGSGTSTGNGETGTGSSGDGDATSGDGDGDGDTTAGDGDGDGTGAGDGDGDTGGGEDSCQSDEDCVAVWTTDAPCYSAGCSLPIAASKSAAEEKLCWIPWNGSMGPEAPDGCRPNDDGVVCDASCALPPDCALPSCGEDGVCQVRFGYSQAECQSDGTAECERLQTAFSTALAAARSCLAGGVTPTHECDAGNAVSDLCGCPQAVSSEHAEALVALERARSSFEAKCETPEMCQLVDCAQDGDAGTCQLTTHPDGVCVFE